MVGWLLKHPAFSILPASAKSSGSGHPSDQKAEMDNSPADHRDHWDRHSSRVGELSGCLSNHIADSLSWSYSLAPYGWGGLSDQKKGFSWVFYQIFFGQLPIGSGHPTKARLRNADWFKVWQVAASLCGSTLAATNWKIPCSDLWVLWASSWEKFHNCRTWRQFIAIEQKILTICNDYIG